MANKASRPGRTLIVFALVIAGHVRRSGPRTASGSPSSGSTCRAAPGSRSRRRTETGEEITPEKLEEAAGIIDSRVNAYGVAESEVATQGGRNIIVEIPGQNREGPRRHRQADRAAALPPRRGQRRRARRRPQPQPGARRRRRRRRERHGRQAATAARRGKGKATQKPGPRRRAGGPRAVRGAASRADETPRRQATTGSRPSSPAPGAAGDRSRAAPASRPAPRRPTRTTSSVDELLAWIAQPRPGVAAASSSRVHLRGRGRRRRTTRPSRCSPATRRASSTSCRRRSSRAPSSTTPASASRRTTCSTSSTSTSTARRPTSSPT